MEIGVGMAVSSICSADPAHPRNVAVMTITPDAGAGQIWSSNDEVRESTAGSSTNHSAIRSRADRLFHGTLLGLCQLKALLLFICYRYGNCQWSLKFLYLLPRLASRRNLRWICQGYLLLISNACGLRLRNTSYPHAKIQKHRTPKS